MIVPVVSALGSICWSSEAGLTGELVGLETMSDKTKLSGDAARALPLRCFVLVALASADNMLEPVPGQCSSSIASSLFCLGCIGFRRQHA
jgi:hypothetical protein